MQALSKDERYFGGFLHSSLAVVLLMLTYPLTLSASQHLAQV